ncbi:MAG: hypothetical protein LBB73_09835, partial [Dysgonamonadaceae bacterium]|nr:hypothetical protein [Dysgonamonadaceae bacterium]
KYIEVTGLFTPRGGIAIYPYCNYGKPGTEYESLAKNRLFSRNQNGSINKLVPFPDMFFDA